MTQNNKLDTYELFYDGDCPICGSFVQLIRKKVDASKLKFIPINKGENFRFVTMEGLEFRGEEAVNALADAFPTVLNYFWMLPTNLKKPALNLAYTAGAAIRSVLKKDADCGCNKGK